MLPSSGDRSRTPTYDLEEVQRLVGQGPISCRITRTALLGATGLQLADVHVIEAVLLLNRSDFYKSMPSDESPGLWQDVYRTRYRGLELYIKLQINEHGFAVVIQFKRR